jgi:hypothetical protein
MSNFDPENAKDTTKTAISYRKFSFFNFYISVICDSQVECFFLTLESEGLGTFFLRTRREETASKT